MLFYEIHSDTNFHIVCFFHLDQWKKWKIPMVAGAAARLGSLLLHVGLWTLGSLNSTRSSKIHWIGLRDAQWKLRVKMYMEIPVKIILASTFTKDSLD